MGRGWAPAPRVPAKAPPSFLRPAPSPCSVLDWASVWPYQVPRCNEYAMNIGVTPPGARRPTRAGSRHDHTFRRGSQLRKPAQPTGVLKRSRRGQGATGDPFPRALEPVWHAAVAALCVSWRGNSSTCSRADKEKHTRTAAASRPSVKQCCSAWISSMHQTSSTAKHKEPPALLAASTSRCVVCAELTPRWLRVPGQQS